MSENYGVGPAKPLERKSDPILERAVRLVQQAFPGTREVEESPILPRMGAQGEAAKPPPLDTSPPQQTGSSPQSSPPPPPTPDRRAFLEALRELCEERFAPGSALAGYGATWLVNQMRRYGVRRIDELTIEQLYSMCEELEKQKNFK